MLKVRHAILVIEMVKIVLWISAPDQTTSRLLNAALKIAL